MAITNGGGGSRTRVRKYAIVGLYMRSRSCLFAIHVEERRKPWIASPDLSRRHPSEQQSGDQPAFMTSIPIPQARTRGTSRT